MKHGVCLRRLGKVTFPGECLPSNTAGWAGSLKNFIYDDIIDRENNVPSFRPDSSFPTSCSLDHIPPGEWNSWLRKTFQKHLDPHKGVASSRCSLLSPYLCALSAGQKRVFAEAGNQPWRRRQNQNPGDQLAGLGNSNFPESEKCYCLHQGEGSSLGLRRWWYNLNHLVSKATFEARTTCSDVGAAWPSLHACQALGLC